MESVNSIAALKEVVGQENSIINVLGYYEPGDGGGGLFYYDSTATISSNDGTAIKPNSVTNGRWIRNYSGAINVKWFGAKGNSVFDDTIAFQRAANLGASVYVPKGHYILSSSVDMHKDFVMMGEDRSVIIENLNDEVFAFSYMSPITATGYDIDSGMRLENFHLKAKFGIKLNQGGDYINVFSKQAAFKNIIIRHLTIEGVYLDIPDVNKETAVEPTLKELLEYGVGIEAHKLLDSLIQNCYFLGNGIGTYLDGCDINKLDTNRYTYNARHVHIFSHNTWGYQNKFSNNDVLWNLRFGGIYTNAPHTSIKDNYFETYALSGCYILLENGYGALIWGNRFDTNSTSTPIVSLAPSYGCIFSNNRTSPAAPSPNIQVKEENYNPGVANLGNNYLINFSGNSGTIILPDFPCCEYGKDNPRLFNSKNPKPLSGNQSVIFPWVRDSAGNWVLRSDTDTLIINFETEPNDNLFTLKACAKYIAGSGYVVVRWGGLISWQGNLGFANNGNYEVKSITCPIPAGASAGSPIQLEIVNSQAAYRSIELIPN